jgi:hypothetical protein
MRGEDLFAAYKEKRLHGRYITLEHIGPLLKGFNEIVNVNVAGNSVLGQPIYACGIGSGKTRILMWSQMHGNESTTTKAVFDFINFLCGRSASAEAYLAEFTFLILPMLNPDGAQAYTRENANNVDLNRDFVHLTQPESTLLNDLFQKFAPDFCFNLHDQRTIYAVGNTDNPATISFLAPAYNEAREINETRTTSINVIARINDVLQELIPAQIGRFDDSFNPNCVGDSFQSNGVPTILFEAGHFVKDYDREMTRKFIFIAMESAIKCIYDNDIVGNRIADYLKIPQNKVSFYDFVYKNVRINYDGNEIITNFAAQFNEELSDGKISFVACFSEIGITGNVYGHIEYDANQELYADENNGIPFAGQKADFYIGNVKFVNGAKVVLS